MLRACLIGFAQTPLMRSANTGDTARRDLAPLADECVQHLRVFVIDVVDLLDAEPAHFLAPEILLLRGDRLVAPGGPLGRRYRSSASLFCHVNSPCPSALTHCPRALRPRRCCRRRCCGRGCRYGRPGMRSGPAAPGSAGTAGRSRRRRAGRRGFRAARFSRAFFRFSIRFIFSSMRTVMNFRTKSETRSRRSISFTASGPAPNCNRT